MRPSAIRPTAIGSSRRAIHGKGPVAARCLTRPAVRADGCPRHGCRLSAAPGVSSSPMAAEAWWEPRGCRRKVPTVCRTKRASCAAAFVMSTCPPYPAAIRNAASGSRRRLGACSLARWTGSWRSAPEDGLGGSRGSRSSSRCHSDRTSSIPVHPACSSEVRMRGTREPSAPDRLDVDAFGRARHSEGGDGRVAHREARSSGRRRAGKPSAAEARRGCQRLLSMM